MSEGRAVVAPWLIKLLAGALIAAGVAWAGNDMNVNATQNTDIAVHAKQFEVLDQRLSRMETKLDMLLMQQRKEGGP